MSRVFTPITNACFSSIVDEVISVSGIYAEYPRVINFTRLTLEEAHAKGFFERDMTELAITVDTPYGSPFIYPIPLDWKRARYLEIAASKTPIPFIAPGENAGTKTLFYYQALDSLIFSGLSAGDIINIAYYKKPKSFKYYDNLATGTISPFSAGYVPAYYDVVDGIWYYLYTDGNGISSYVTSIVSPIPEQEKSADWVILRHSGMILQGVLTKVHRERGDKEKASFAFSLYSTLLGLFLEQEVGMPLGQLA